MKQELLKGLSEEQVAKIRNCKTHEEMLKLAKEEGIELTDEQLEVVSGGGVCSSFTRTCPECGEWLDLYDYGNRYRCGECDCWWNDDGIYCHGKKYKGNQLQNTQN